MKCQHCEKPATFHITELTGDKPAEFHLCEIHAKLYLMQPEQAGAQAPTLANVLSQQLGVSQTAEELEKLDKRACPECGITFFEFRNQGRLGCAHDYVFFEAELDPLISNIHGATQHVGKKPKRGGDLGTERRSDLSRLRKELDKAIKREDYEQASQLRDQIRQMESEGEQETK
jgi:protein arginine kinase activator